LNSMTVFILCSGRRRKRIIAMYVYMTNILYLQ
jgi:hypothetical protein